VLFVFCFLLSLSSFCIFVHSFIDNYRFSLRISRLFRSSSTFISGNRNENSAQGDKQVRGKSKKQKAKSIVDEPFHYSYELIEKHYKDT